MVSFSVCQPVCRLDYSFLMLLALQLSWALTCRQSSPRQPLCEGPFSRAEGPRMLCGQPLSCAGIHGPHQRQLHRMGLLAVSCVMPVLADSSCCMGFGFLSPAELS